MTTNLYSNYEYAPIPDMCLSDECYNIIVQAVHEAGVEKGQTSLMLVIASNALFTYLQVAQSLKEEPSNGQLVQASDRAKGKFTTKSDQRLKALSTLTRDLIFALDKLNLPASARSKILAAQMSQDASLEGWMAMLEQ